MGISKKVRGALEQGSWIRRMFEDGIKLKEEFGADNVFDLSLGNPVMQPPKEFYEKLSTLVSSPNPGMHRYMPNAGYFETRDAVALSLEEEFNFSFHADDIVMTVGAGGALNVIFKALLDPKDEVVILSPYFVEYRLYVDNHGGSSIVVPPNDDFLPDLQALRESFNEHTKVLLINSPNNPTGVMYPEGTIKEIIKLVHEAEERFDSEIYIVSDEPYRKIVFDNFEYPNVFELHNRYIVATSHSKDLALPGERIGYIAVHPKIDNKSELVDALIFCNRSLGFVNAPALMQHVVGSLQSVTVDVGEYQKKRDFLYPKLIDMGYEIVKPNGAFYMFPRSPIEDDVKFTEELSDHKVLVVPGRGFGLPGYFRLSYCLEDNILEGSLAGFEAAISKYRNS